MQMESFSEKLMCLTTWCGCLTKRILFKEEDVCVTPYNTDTWISCYFCMCCVFIVPCVCQLPTVTHWLCITLEISGFELTVSSRSLLFWVCVCLLVVYKVRSSLIRLQVIRKSVYVLFVWSICCALFPFWNALQRNYIEFCLQAAELQEKLGKTLEENQKFQEKLLLLTREKQATDKKVPET